MDPRTRERLKRAAARLGVERPLRAVRRALLETPLERRDRADNERMSALLADVLGPDSVAVDVGAHAGGILAEIVRLAPRGRHIACEPLPGLAAELARRFPTVEVHACALSDRSGEREFVHVETRPSWSGFRERPYPGPERLRRITVPVARLDDLVAPDVAPALIKIDVEGAEHEVLAGAMATIERHRPVILFEHGLGSADYFGTAPGDVWALLVERAGLRIFNLEGEGPYTRARFTHEFAAQTRVNFVARP